MAKIVAKLHLLQVERELFFGDAMKFGQPFFGIAPKAFQAIDVDFEKNRTDLFLPGSPGHV
jgi:hypothetical protein